jgi:transmembrane sensor
MDELARQLDTLRDAVEPRWDEERNARLYAGVGQLRRRRQRQRIVGGAALLACLAAFVLAGSAALDRGVEPRVDGVIAVAPTGSAPASPGALAPNRDEAAPGTQPVRVAAGSALWLSDGSLVQVAPGAGVLEVVSDSTARVKLRLGAGAAHFQVVPNLARSFVVDAGSVQVAVVGTVFDVEHVGELVRVAVSEGKVRVNAANGEAFVAAGQSRWFDAHGLAAEEPNAREAPQAPSANGEPSAPQVQRDAKRHGSRRAVVSGALSWRSLSQNGDYDAAYRSIEQGADVGNDPAELMDAADAARLSGHPLVAATYLRRVLSQHRGSPVAPLAAFTLGRVLLERLGQPSEAAESFASARALAPRGSLAQDALAREVEALSKAGDTHQAYLRARAYVQAYPDGRRLRAVQLYGGLERE